MQSVIRMANDIAAQFPHKEHDAAVEAIARHINTFWEPRMRDELAELAEAHRGELREIVFDVIPLLHLDAEAGASRH